MKTHLKRIAAPKTWPILRKHSTFVTRPRPKGQPMEWTLPVSVVLRDMLGLVRTTREAIRTMHAHEIAVNGKRVYKADSAIGFMDTLTIGKEAYRVMINTKGQLTVTPAKDASAPQKIRGKTTLAGGKVQINCLSGMNLIVDKDTFKTGDSIVVEKGKVKTHLPLEKGAHVFVTGGAHIGARGTVENIDGQLITIKTDKDSFTTTKHFTYIVSKDM